MKEVVLWEEGMIALLWKDVVSERWLNAGIGLERVCGGVAKHIDYELQKDQSWEPSRVLF